MTTLICPHLTIHERLAYALVMLHFLKRELETLLWVPSFYKTGRWLNVSLASTGSRTERCLSCTSSESECDSSRPRASLNIHFSSAHYHILAGLFLAIDVYRPGYSATSESMKGTIYENTTFLWSCVAVWLVR